MHRAETRPISRLVIGTLFALGILRAARRISRQRAKLAAPDIELRRLISLSAAVDALGNIATGVAGYAFTFAIGFTVGLGLITVLGIATPVLWPPMRVFLFLVFGIGPGLAFGFVASLGFRAAFRYLITPTKLRWVNNAIALAPNRSIRVLSAFADLFTAVNGVVRIPGMVAAISWPVGAALGLFAFLSVERMVGSVLVVVAFVIVISVAVRIFLVIPLRWLNQRRRLRPDNPSD